MATRTTNYGLYKPDPTDNYGDFLPEFNANMDEIDEHLGGGGGGGGHTIVDENGSDMASEPKLQFTGNVNVTDDSVNGKTVVDIPNSSGAGHTIIDPNGSSMTQRSGLKFTGNVSVTDDSANNETIIDILGGGGGGSLECYLDNGLVADDVGAYITCPLDKTMTNGVYLYIIDDGGVTPQSYCFFVWTGSTYVSPIGSPQITITANTAGLTYYSGAWREIRAYIYKLSSKSAPSPVHYIEYIQSTGTQYINTGVGANAQSIRIESAIEFQTTSSDGFAWGGFGNGHYGLADIYNDRMYNRLKFFYGSNQNISVNSPVYSAETKFVIDMTATGSQISYTINGESATVAKSGSYLAPSDICLFRRGTDTSYTGRCKMYYFKLYVDGTLVRNMKPALDDNNVACMYDEISGGYFYNLGSGVFTAGGDI